MDRSTDEGDSEFKLMSDADRLRAEVDRFRAESRKLKLEADQLEHEMALPFFRRSGFVKAAAAGVLALPLIWFYLDKIVIPYQNAKAELLSIENEKSKNKLDELQEDLAKRRQELEVSRQELTQMEARLNGTLQGLADAQKAAGSALETMKRNHKDVDLARKISQMQDDLTRRSAQLDAAVSSVAQISEGLTRPVPAPPPATLAPTEEPQMPPVSQATVVFNTTGDDKDDDAYVSIAINSPSGAVFSWSETEGQDWERGSERRIALNRVASLPLSLLDKATIEICLSRKKEHGWQFDYSGTLLVGNEVALSFSRKGNVIPHGAGVSCVGFPIR